MNCAVVSAYSQGFRRVAHLCTPSHRCLASRLEAPYFEFGLSDNYRWRQLELIRDQLSDWHSVLWLDADCIVPAEWMPPRIDSRSKIFLPFTRSGPQLWAGLWVNSPEAFNFLRLMRIARACDPAQTPGEALSKVFNFELAAVTGRLDRGLVHYGGLDQWEKQLKLKEQTSIYEMA